MSGDGSFMKQGLAIAEPAATTDANVELRATLIITTAALGIAIAMLQHNAPAHPDLRFLKQKYERANKLLGIKTD